MVSKREHLTQELRDLAGPNGHELSLEQLVDQWFFLRTYNAHNDTSCICTQKHIVKVSVIQRHGTGEQLLVGSDCIKLFFDRDVDPIHALLDRIDYRRRGSPTCPPTKGQLKALYDFYPNIFTKKDWGFALKAAQKSRGRSGISPNFRTQIERRNRIILDYLTREDD